MAQRQTSSTTKRNSTKSMKKSGSRRANASATTKRRGSTEIAEDEVSIDRRRTNRRSKESEADLAEAEAAPLERRKKVNRRRQIDPTTCERDYTDQEVEFMNALDEYKRKSGRMFPTCSEVLEVLRGLGYVKLSAAEAGALAVEISTAASAKPMPSESLAAVESTMDVAATSCEAQLV